VSYLAHGTRGKRTAGGFLMDAIRRREYEMANAPPQAPPSPPLPPTPPTSRAPPLAAGAAAAAAAVAAATPRPNLTINVGERAPGGPAPELAAVWRDIWLCMSEATTAPDPAPHSFAYASAAPSQTLAGVTAAAHGGAEGLSFDTRLFRGALAMIVPFKRCLDPRVALNAALRMVASFDGAALISRRDVEAVFVLAVRTQRDARAVADAVAAAFVLGLTTPYRDGYRAPDARVPLRDVQQLVLPSRALDGVLGRHPASDERLPVTYFELMTPLPLRMYVAKRKAKLARSLAGRDMLRRAQLRPAFAALRTFAKVARAKRRICARIVALYGDWSGERLRSGFERWRRRAVVERARVRLQSFARLVLGKRARVREQAREYLHRQLFVLWMCKRGLVRVVAKRNAKLAAAQHVQRLFRGRRDRRRAAGLAAMRESERAAVIAADAAAAAAVELERRRGVVLRALSSYVRRTRLRRAARRLLADVRAARAMQALRKVVEAEYAASREWRRRDDAKQARMRRDDLMQKKLAAVSRVGLRGVVPDYLGELAGKVVADASSSAEAALAAIPAGSDPGGSGDDERARFFAAKRARARIVSDTLRGAGGGALLPADAGAKLPQREAYRRLLRFLRRLVGRARVRLLMQGRVERRFQQGGAAKDATDGDAASSLRKHCYYCAWRRAPQHTPARSR
jgi:hypothetical protein